MIKAAIFDLDHTLFDRYGTIKEVLKTAEQDELPFNTKLSREEIADIFCLCDKKYNHKGWARECRELKKYGILKDCVTEENLFQTYIVPLFTKTAVAFPFAIPMLKQLRSDGIKIGLITNGSGALQRSKLKLLGLDNIFDAVLIGGEYGIPKPDTPIFAEMARLLGLKPQEMMYIGDNPVNDIEPSRKVGYIPVWVETTGSWEFPEIVKPKLSVKTVEEIPYLIKEYNK